MVWSGQDLCNISIKLDLKSKIKRSWRAAEKFERPKYIEEVTYRKSRVDQVDQIIAIICWIVLVTLKASVATNVG